MNNPEQRRVLAQLQISGMLSKESIEAGSAPFVEMQNMIRDAIERHIFRVDVPIELISKMLGSWAEATNGPDHVETSHGKEVSRRWICHLLGRDRTEVILCTLN